MMPKNVRCNFLPDLYECWKQSHLKLETAIENINDITCQFSYEPKCYTDIEAEGLLYTNFRAHIYARNNFPLQRFGHAISLTRMCMTLRNMLLIFKSEINFSV